MDEHTKNARNWLLAGVLALALAGLLAVVLVAARTPQLAAISLFKDLFGRSLVIHVDLSVLVWFLAAAGMLWNLMEHREERRDWPCLSQMHSGGLWTFFAGTMLMVLSVAMGGESLKNNYVPMLTNIGFILALGLVLAGSTLAALAALGQVRRQHFTGEPGALNFGIVGSALMLPVAMLCFYLSAEGAKGRVEGEQLYEIVFWGGGHLLQFLYVQIMMVAWVWLARARGIRLPDRLLYLCFIPGPAMVLSAPAVYLLYDVTSFEYQQFFTEQMKWGLGIAPVLLAAGMVREFRVSSFEFREKKANSALSSALAMSLLLFFFGGVFGLWIEGENVMTPAHYHGSIVGVTLALMGAVYLLLPRFGGQQVAHWRTAFWQPVIYGAGQIMHISGLAYSGGYAVLRKTPGAVTDAARAAMGFMGLGGLLAIVGGILFVIVVIRGMRSHSTLNSLK